MSDQPAPILCRECECEIDDHGYDSDLARFVCCAGNCRCRERPSDIARALLAAPPTETEVRAALPIGLCGNRDDHDPHVMLGAAIGDFYCSADQSTRLPYAHERRLAARAKDAAREVRA